MELSAAHEADWLMISIPNPVKSQQQESTVASSTPFQLNGRVPAI